MVKKINVRKQEIDTLRGIACILVVSFHAMWSLINNGLVSELSISNQILLFLAFIRMPLFTFLGGYVYSLRPVIKGMLPKFIKGKWMRLLLPAVFVGIPISLIQFFFGTGNNYTINDLIYIPIYPLGVFWYLYAMFIVFLVTSLLDYYKILDSNKKIIIFFLLSLVLFSVNSLREIKLFSIGGAVYLFPFFILGIFSQRNKEVLKEKFRKIIFVMACIGGIYVIYKISNNLINISDIKGGNIFYFLLSILFCLALYLIELKNNLLAWIGIYSYSIYLFHSLLVAAPRIVLSKLGIQIDSDMLISLIFVASVLLGIFLPILIDKTLSKNKIFSLCFLGKRKKS